MTKDIVQSSLLMAAWLKSRNWFTQAVRMSLPVFIIMLFYLADGITDVVKTYRLPESYITRLVLNGGQFDDDICISILNWLWEKEEALHSEGPLLSQQTLIRFSAKLTDDRQKQALLIQSLKDGRASPTFIRSVLQTFRHPDYAAFLTEKNHRSIVYSDVMWTLAVQLGRCEFIRPPKPTHENTRIRIEPFINGEKGYD
ncbi:hypothetical protein ACPW54_004964 [Escherichia coli]